MTLQTSMLVSDNKNKFMQLFGILQRDLGVHSGTTHLVILIDRNPEFNQTSWTLIDKKQKVKKNIRIW